MPLSLAVSSQRRAACPHRRARRLAPRSPWRRSRSPVGRRLAPAPLSLAPRPGASAGCRCPWLSLRSVEHRVRIEAIVAWQPSHLGVDLVSQLVEGSRQHLCPWHRGRELPLDAAVPGCLFAASSSVSASTRSSLGTALALASISFASWSKARASTSVPGTAAGSFRWMPLSLAVSSLRRASCTHRGDRCLAAVSSWRRSRQPVGRRLAPAPLSLAPRPGASAGCRCPWLSLRSVEQRVRIDALVAWHRARLGVDLVRQLVEGSRQHLCPWHRGRELPLDAAVPGCLFAPSSIVYASRRSLLGSRLILA